MEDDDDLWGPPFVVQDDTFRLLRGCEFWFDCRTDVLEENFQNERYCELVWRILNEKEKQVVVIDERDSVSFSVQNDVASSSGTGDSHEIGSSDSDKTVSAVIPDADTSSSKSVLGEDENTSSISDAQTIETRDSCTDIEDVDTETRLKPQETAAKDSITVEVAEDADTSSSPVLGNKIEEAEEHSCSSLVTDQVFDSIKQAPENKSSSAISRENIGEKVQEKVNATNEDGEILKDHQQSDSLQDVVTVSEPFTTESLLEMFDEPENKGREKSHPEAVKTVVKEELIVNFLNEARKKAATKALLTTTGSVLPKKRQSKSNISISKGMNSSFIRTTKQKIGVEAGESNTESTPKTISDAGISISDLKNKTGKELRSIAKELKVTHYYKLKKEDLLQQIIAQLTECTKQIMES